MSHATWNLDAFLPAIKGAISRELQENGCSEATADIAAGKTRDFIALAPEMIGLLEQAGDFLELNGTARVFIVEQINAFLRKARA